MIHLKSPLAAFSVLCLWTAPGLWAAPALAQSSSPFLTPLIGAQEPPLSIPSVAELSDVAPGDWAFQALQSLIDRYNCLSGTPNQQYLGQQSTTRFEFAAALNACLQGLEAARGLDTESMETLQRLQSDFSAELTGLQQRVNTLAPQVDQLAARQFSPLTKLSGEAIIAIAGAVGGNRADDPEESIDANLSLGNRLRLNFDTSFTGQDRLRVRLQARNLAQLEDVTGTQMANLSFDGEDGNILEIADLEYQFPLGQSTRIYVSAEGAGLRDYVGTVNPYFSSSGEGSISIFGRENPVTRQGGGAGFGISHDFNKIVNLGVGYVANNGNDPTQGLFGDRDSAIAQLTLKPTKALALGLTYVRSFNNVDTGTGSALSSDPFDDESESVIANAWSAEVAYGITPNVNLGGRLGFIQATATDLDDDPTADILTWSIQLGILDLGKEDSLLGLVFGQPPKVTRNQFGVEFEDPDTSLHFEAFYRYQVTDNIGLTPGVIMILNPEHNSANDPIFVGTVRATFRF